MPTHTLPLSADCFMEPSCVKETSASQMEYSALLAQITPILDLRAIHSYITEGMAIASIPSAEKGYISDPQREVLRKSFAAIGLSASFQQLQDTIYELRAPEEQTEREQRFWTIFHKLALESKKLETLYPIV
jgi:hypothetical protein